MTPYSYFLKRGRRKRPWPGILAGDSDGTFTKQGDYKTDALDFFSRRALGEDGDLIQADYMNNENNKESELLSLRAAT